LTSRVIRLAQGAQNVRELKQQLMRLSRRLKKSSSVFSVFGLSRRSPLLSAVSSLCAPYRLCVGCKLTNRWSIISSPSSSKTMADRIRRLPSEAAVELLST